jgi:hypothetical protein
VKKPGRNDPCPCGSGKKYKRCCLANLGAWERQRNGLLTTLEVVMEWLMEHHEEAVERAFQDRLDRFVAPEQTIALKALHPNDKRVIDINLLEEFLAEGVLLEGDVARPVRDLVLGPEGAPLNATQRDWLERWLERPLGLFAVEAAGPDHVVVLRDTLEDEKAPRLRVFDPDFSPDLPIPYFYATRVVPGDPGVASYCHFDISPEAHPGLRKRLLAVLKDHEDPQERRAVLSDVVLDEWLFGLLAPEPQVLHNPSGEPLLLTTDHYEVRDWDRLAAALESQPDVDGDREQGWVRLEEPKQDFTRALLTINLGQKDRIELFAHSASLAEKGARWFQALAGDAVRHLSRQVKDPGAR